MFNLIFVQFYYILERMKNFNLKFSNWNVGACKYMKISEIV